MNIFERASRAQLRIASPRGELTVEQLWELPLTTKGSGLHLDQLARRVNSELKDLEGGSFVITTPNPHTIELMLQLDILKHIIESKIADQTAAEKRAANMARRAKLMAAIEAADNKELEGKSKDELLAEIAALEA